MSQSGPPEMPQSQQRTLKNLRHLAFLLDNSIPIPFTRYRMGIDPILGLLGIVGGTGDIVGGVLGAYIVVEATRMGVEPRVIRQMIGNLFFDLLAGLVPGLGDLLDVTWKANARNVALLDQYYETPRKPQKNSPLLVLGVIILLALMVIGITAVMVLLLRAIAAMVS
ncbi:MAG: DUF4112 domain-containing protein [Cyanobacteria bacterium P01_F01_bin.42]